MYTARLFILEDDPLQLYALSKLLESIGHEVVGTATNAEEAYKVLQTLEYGEGLNVDLLLIDIHLLQGKDGITFVKSLPKRWKVPHIYITAYNDETHFQRCLDTNPVGFILKPYSKHTLAYQIQVALRNIHIEEEVEHTRNTITQLISICNRSQSMEALAKDFCKGLQEGFKIPKADFFYVASNQEVVVLGTSLMERQSHLSALRPYLSRWKAEFPHARKLVSEDLSRFREIGKSSLFEVDPDRSRLFVPVPNSKEEKPELLGIVCIEYTSRGDFLLPMVELVELASLQAGMAIERIQVQESTEQKNRELAIYNRVLEVVGTALHSAEFLPAVLEILVEKLGADGGMVYKYDPVERVLRLVCRIGVGESVLEELDRIPLATSFLGQVAQGNFTLSIEQVDREKGRLPDSAIQAGWKSLLVSPIKREHALYGMITLFSLKEGTFDPLSSHVLTAVSGQVSIALENAFLYQRTLTMNQELEQRVKERTEDLDTLSRLSQELIFVVGYQELFILLFSILQSVTRFALGAVFFQQEGKGVVFLYPRVPLTQDCLERAKEKIEGHVLHVTDNQVLLKKEDYILLDSKIPDTKPKRVGFLHVEPFWQRNERTRDQGFLYFFSEEGIPFQEREIHLFNIAAHHASLMVQSLEYRIGIERKRLEQIVTGLPDGLMIFDREQNLVVRNPKTDTLRELISKHDPSVDLIERIRSLPISKEARILEIGVEKKLYLQISSEPISEGPDAGGMIVLIRDVTTERLREEQMNAQERLAAVGQLAAGIAHDFNNILTGIIGYAEYLQIRKDVSQEARLYLLKIIEQSKRAGALVQQILDFSRKSMAEHKPFDLIPFLKELSKLFDRLISENIHTEWILKEKSCIIEGSPVQVQQIMTNLVVNAQDAMPKGGTLTVTVDTLPVESEVRGKEAFRTHPPSSGKLVRIQVEDTGTGIPPEILPRVFEPFFTTKPVGKGTGLGLAQVYGLVQQHKGFVYLESTVGKGTRVTILFPLVEQEGTREPEALTLELPEHSSGLILYVEDEEAVRDVALRFLHEMGYKMLVAVNGKDAWELFQAHHSQIDLVISDIVMPEMDGRELVHRIREIAPRMKILLTTGYPLGSDREEENLPKVDGILYKPLQVADLVRAIERLRSQT
ncbi:MAG: response regulator [Spirochaetes bacterium]|nr:response regulator [Spirochaetota bacterium]